MLLGEEMVKIGCAQLRLVKTIHENDSILADPGLRSKEECLEVDC